MNETTLKPCPFCGSKNIFIHHTKEMIYQIRCGMCGASTTYFVKRANAIKAWNRRANENPIDESPFLSGDEYEQMIKEDSNERCRNAQ